MLELLRRTRSPRPRPLISPRKPEFPFPADFPRHWVLSSTLGTALANSLNLVFPLGERFFIRAVRAYADRIEDPALAQQVKGFIAQEVRHGMEHENFFAVLEAQGFDVQRFLRIYQRIAFELIEPRTSPGLRLATTAALEHFTATLAHTALERGLPNLPSPMRELLLWHAAEEIEHKAVAFDVLEAVEPSYALRMAGLAVATTTLIGFWFLGAAMLLAQDPDASIRRIRREVRRGPPPESGPHPLRQILGSIGAYARPGFHPSHNDDAALAAEYLARANLA